MYISLNIFKALYKISPFLWGRNVLQSKQVQQDGKKRGQGETKPAAAMAQKFFPILSTNQQITQLRCCVYSCFSFFFFKCPNPGFVFALEAHFLIHLTSEYERIFLLLLVFQSRILLLFN